LLDKKNEAVMHPDIFTELEICTILRISRVTLWRERTKGRISFRRAASKIIYTRADLEAYLESTKREAFNADA
jgi:hypothetical protein